MKSRLEALLRQRQLVGEHLEWLDEEITAERTRVASIVVPGTGASPVVSSADTGTPQIAAPPPAASATAGESPAGGAFAPATLPPEVPEPNVKGLHDEVRRGCLIYLVVAAAVVGGLLLFIYLRY